MPNLVTPWPNQIENKKPLYGQGVTIIIILTGVKWVKIFLEITEGALRDFSKSLFIYIIRCIEFYMWFILKIRSRGNRATVSPTSIVIVDEVEVSVVQRGVLSFVQ